jgi:hypothetical protein
VVNSLLTTNTQVNQAEITRHVTALNRIFSDPSIAQVWNPLTAAGRAALDAMIRQQAQINAYIDDYQLLAEPIVQLLMHRDRTDEATVRRLLRQASAAVRGQRTTLANSLSQQFHRGVDQVVPQISRFRHQAGGVRAVDHQRYLRRDLPESRQRRCDGDHRLRSEPVDELPPWASENGVSGTISTENVSCTVGSRRRSRHGTA